jgi:hypothetical protein
MATPISVEIDTGTSTTDSFADTNGVSAVWDFRISDGTNSRAGELRGDWDEIASSTPAQGINRIKDIGTIPSTVTIVIDKNINTIRVRVAVPTDDWTFKALRHLVQP